MKLEEGSKLIVGNELVTIEAVVNGKALASNGMVFFEEQEDEEELKAIKLETKDSHIPDGEELGFIETKKERDFIIKAIGKKDTLKEDVIFIYDYLVQAGY